MTANTLHQKYVTPKEKSKCRTDTRMHQKKERLHPETFLLSAVAICVEMLYTLPCCVGRGLVDSMEANERTNIQGGMCKALMPPVWKIF